MPKVSSPGELGIGRGAGKLSALDLPRRQASASPEAFGAGVRNYAPTAEAFGGVTIAPHYEPAKSGFELLLETVGKLADTGFDTALAVDRANTSARIQQSALEASTEYTQQNLAREATIEEGADPGEYAKTAAADFETWKAKRLEGLGGREKLAMEQHLGQLALHNMEQATSFQAQRARQHREAINKAAVATTKESISSYYSTVFTDPGQMEAVRKLGLDRIDGLQVADDVKIELRRDLIGGTAAAMWARKAETDPYGTRDAMLRGDQGEMAGLEADKRIAFLHAAQVDIRGLEAEARQQANEARAETARIRAQNETNQRLDAAELAHKVERATDQIALGKSPDGGAPAVNELSKRLETLRDASTDPDNKRRLDDQIEKLHGTLDTASFAYEFKNKSHADKVVMFEKLRTEAVDPEDYTAASMLKAAGDILKDENQALKDGKFLEAGNEAGWAQLTPVSPTDPESVAKRERDVQQIALGIGVPEGHVPRLTKDEAAQKVEEITSIGSTDAVIATLTGYLGSLDEPAQRAWLDTLEEQKLPPAYRGVMEALKRGDGGAAREIAGRATVKPGELPAKGTATPEKIEDAVDAVLNDPKSNRAALAWNTARLTGDPAAVKRAEKDRAEIIAQAKFNNAKGQDVNAAAKNAAATWSGAGPVAGNADIQYVVPPKDVDPSDWENALTSARRMAPLEMRNPLDPAAQPGLLVPGNIDLNARPQVPNPEGGISTVHSVSFNIDGQEVLIPTVTDDGRLVEPDEALAIYQKTHKHLGIFDSEQNATAYAEKLHQDQDLLYGRYGGNYTAMQADRNKKAARIRNDGFWTDDGDGKTFTLHDPSGLAMGSYFKEEIEALAAKARTVPGAPGAGMPLQEIFGR